MWQALRKELHPKGLEIVTVGEEILGSEATRTGTDLASALETLSKIARRRSVAFVLSDFFASGAFSGSTGDIFPALIGDGTTWETYSFTVTIPTGTEGIKVVPLWGAGSSIGYDNVGVDDAPVETPLIPNGDFENGRDLRVLT